MECDVVKKNLGRSRCNKLPGLIKSMITTPDDFVIPAATAADAELLEEFLQDALLDNIALRIYKWPDFATFENISQEAAYEDTVLAYLPVKDGNYRFKFGIRENICAHKAFYTHRALNQGRVFLVDTENQLLGTEKSNGDVIGLAIQVLHTEKFIFNDGSASTKSPIVVGLVDNKEVDKNGVLLQCDFFTQLYRIVDVSLVIVSAVAAKIVCTVKATCDGTPVNGLVLADFILKTSLGVTQTITSVTEDDGEYTLNDTDFADGTLEIRPASTLTVKAYELLEPVAVNVV